MRIFLSILLITGLSSAIAQASLKMSRPDPSHKRVKVMLVGVFHFANPGLDSYKEVFPFDPLTPEHQIEIEEVVSSLKKFEATKIGLEYPAKRDVRMDSLYHQYLEGNYSLGINENYQLGFRLAEGIDKVFGIDARGRNFETLQNMSNAEYEKLEEHLVQIGMKAKPQTKIWYPIYEKRYRYEDSLKAVLPLNEYLMFLNDSSNLSHEHGIYLVDSFKLGIGEQDNYFGPDMYTRWYNRNLRILQNIYRIIDGPEDRVLVVIGSGHLPLLQQMIEASPELELVQANQYLSEN